MSGFLLDTNVISELVKVRPAETVLEWFEAADEQSLYLSVLTFGEIRQGLALLAQGRRRTRLEGWLEIELRARFASRILPVDDAVADRWGQLAAQRQLIGKTMSVVDGLLAATALERNLTMVTRNVRDFEDLGLACLSPWRT